jgi:hypothetical protein
VSDQPTMAALLTEIQGVRADITRYRTDTMTRIDGMEDRLTHLLRDIGVNWNNAQRIENKVDNTREEGRGTAQLIGEVMRLVRGMEERIAQLERGRAD